MVSQVYNHRNIAWSKISRDKISLLLSSPGVIQYEVLSGLLLQYKRIPKYSKQVVDRLIDTPPGWWVGGSLGQATREGLIRPKKLEEAERIIKPAVLKLSNNSSKQIVGALLAEMAQHDSDSELRLTYKDLLHSLARDPMAVHYAGAWMDHQLNSFEFLTEEYWAKIKAHLAMLSTTNRETAP